MVPPCFNKYYILDLQPDNSVVRYMVSQGHTVFLVSWKNPDASMAQVSWEDYVGKGVIRAIDVVKEIG
jgi:polyhydroxyalkanoate synthase